MVKKRSDERKLPAEKTIWSSDERDPYGGGTT